MSGWSEVAVKTPRLINRRPLTKAQARIRDEKEVKECDHEKQAVEVEIFPGPDYLPGMRLIRKAWYCPTCRRVTPRVNEEVEVV